MATRIGRRWKSSWFYLFPALSAHFFTFLMSFPALYYSVQSFGGWVDGRTELNFIRCLQTSDFRSKEGRTHTQKDRNLILVLYYIYIWRWPIMYFILIFYVLFSSLIILIKFSSHSLTLIICSILHVWVLFCKTG